VGLRFLAALATVLASVGCSGQETDIGGMHFTELLVTPGMMQSGISPTVRPEVVFVEMPVADAKPSDLALFHRDTMAQVAGRAEPTASPWSQQAFEFVPSAPLDAGLYTFRFVAWGRIGVQPSPVLRPRAMNGLDAYDSFFEVGGTP